MRGEGEEKVGVKECIGKNREGRKEGEMKGGDEAR